MKRLNCASILLMTMLVACSGGSDQTDQQTNEERDSVFDPLTQSIDRAKSVQNTVDAQAEEQRRQIEEAEGK